MIEMTATIPVSKWNELKAMDWALICIHEKVILHPTRRKVGAGYGQSRIVQKNKLEAWLQRQEDK
jgi:hypothetical protein